MNDEWETPPEIFKPLDDEFHFQIDAAATSRNCLLPGGGYFTKEKDALKYSWDENGYGPVWCNPPYSKKAGPIGRWVEHALGQAMLVVMLLPSDTGTAWFHRLLRDDDVEIRFLTPRVRFLLDGAVQGNPRFASIVAVIRG